MNKTFAGISDEAMEAALIEGAAFLQNAIDESVPLRDYRASVEVFFSALMEDLVDG